MTGRTPAARVGALVRGVSFVGVGALLLLAGFFAPLPPADTKPLQALTLPDAVYANVTRGDLGDLRVFNVEGVAVPYALCPAVTESAGPPTHQSLPVFALRAAPAGADSTDRVRIETADVTRIQALSPMLAEKGRKHIGKRPARGRRLRDRRTRRVRAAARDRAAMDARRRRLRTTDKRRGQ